jgi:hypothetical protein
MPVEDMSDFGKRGFLDIVRVVHDCLNYLGSFLFKLGNMTEEAVFTDWKALPAIKRVFLLTGKRYLCDLKGFLV